MNKVDIKIYYNVKFNNDAFFWLMWLFILLFFFFNLVADFNTYCQSIQTTTSNVQQSSFSKIMSLLWCYVYKRWYDAFGYVRLVRELSVESDCYFFWIARLQLKSTLKYDLNHMIFTRKNGNKRKISRLENWSESEQYSRNRILNWNSHHNVRLYRKTYCQKISR